MKRLLVVSLIASVISICSLSMIAEESAGQEVGPEPVGAAEVKNPYYSDREAPPWKLWFRDGGPVTFSPKRSGQTPQYQKEADRSHSPPLLTERLYPDLSRDPDEPVPFFTFRKFEVEPEVAGWWDDAVASLDENHVRLRDEYRFGNQRIPFKGQMIRVLYGSPRFEDRLKLGINFVWQSHARKGHHLFLENQTTQRMEELFTFANCLYTSPGWLSRTDVMPDRIVDSYDGLFGHYYNSLGQSGSEVHAVAKVIYAAAHLPRETKNLMKIHGVYPLATLTVFKATLPYRDGTGQEVPYENELRHRPSYASHGNSVSPRYVSRELEYHLYDEKIHVRRMVQMAANMVTPPPVTLLRLNECKGALIQSSSYTSVRLHSKTGERVEVTVDLSDSYDLTNRPLTFHAQRVYPGQSNVDVRIDSQGKANVVATYDEKYPRGRFPVILWVENGTECPGNPVFVNIHWPAPDQPARPPYFAPYKPPYMSEEDVRKFMGRGGVNDPNVQVNRNDKPVIQMTVDDPIVTASVGKPVSFQLAGEDPEGFQTRFYQWAGDIGRITDGRFVYTPTKSDRGRTLPVRFICSDGTGAYRGRTVRIRVE